MKGTHIILSGIMLLGLSLASCDQRQESSQDEGSTDRLAERQGVDVNPQSHVDPKDHTDPALTGGGRVGDDTMTPSRNIVANATANKNLTTFVSLVKNADMVNTLNATGPYTVFAPNETAFQALPGGTLKDLMNEENRQRLQEILNNHVVAGKLSVNDLQDGATLKTAGGQQLKVSKRNGQVMINGALIEEPDMMSSNGVLHSVNKVLMPAEQ